MIKIEVCRAVDKKMLKKQIRERYEVLEKVLFSIYSMTLG